MTAPTQTQEVSGKDLEQTLDAAPAPRGRVEPKDAGLPAVIPEVEKFIPLTRYSVAHGLTQRANAHGFDAQTIATTLRYLSCWRHQSYAERASLLQEAYLPFSPDRDTIQTVPYTREQLDSFKDRFMASLEGVVQQANFDEITREELAVLLDEQNPYGLRLTVDLAEYEIILLYARGADTIQKFVRKPETFFLKKVINIPVFRRFFMLFKLKPAEERIAEIMALEGCNRKRAEKLLKRYRKMIPEDVLDTHIYIKMFRVLPRSDVEMMFPNVKVEFRPFDKISLLFTAGGSTAAGIFTTATKLIAAINPVTMVIAIVGFAGVIFRQVMNFFNKKNEYMRDFSQALYFHNLANNRGAISLILDRAEEEDSKEDMLLYQFLLEKGPDGCDPAALDAEIEAYIFNEHNLKIDFDMTDALDRLRASGLIADLPEGRVAVMPPQDASAHLRRLLFDRLDTISRTGLHAAQPVA